MYQTKIDAARVLIEEHNNSLGNGDKLDFDAFLDRLRKQGGTSETTLGFVTYEDLVKCGLPFILAKAVAINIFRVEEKDTTERIIIVDDDPEKLAKKCKPLELVDHYDPEEPENPYGERLKKIVGDTRVLVFDANGNLLVEPTKTEVQRKRDDYPERTEVHVEGSGLLKILRLGDRPDREVDEHPVFTGVALNPDGTSDKGIGWATLDEAIRQLVYIAITNTGELRSTDYDEFDLFDIVAGKSFEHVSRRWPKATIEFQELKKQNRLPRLKVRLGGSENGKPNNPFGKNKSY